MTSDTLTELSEGLIRLSYIAPTTIFMVGAFFALFLWAVSADD